MIPPYVLGERPDLSPSSRLKLYSGYGHGDDQDNPDYERQVEAFVASI